MEFCNEEDDMTWDSDDCVNPLCCSGYCNAIRAQLQYQRSRNQFVRSELLKAESQRDTLTQHQIQELIKGFRLTYKILNK
jgi:hypothetical protein